MEQTARKDPRRQGEVPMHYGLTLRLYAVSAALLAVVGLNAARDLARSARKAPPRTSVASPARPIHGNRHPGSPGPPTGELRPPGPSWGRCMELPPRLSRRSSRVPSIATLKAPGLQGRPSHGLCLPHRHPQKP